MADACAGEAREASAECAVKVGAADGPPSDDLFARLSDLACASWSLSRARASAAVINSAPAPVRSDLLQILHVPTHVSKRQLRFFFGELAVVIREAWLLKDGAPHRYSVLLRACCVAHAEVFRAARHGMRFTPVDVEVAIILPIAEVSHACAPVIEPSTAAGARDVAEEGAAGHEAPMVNADAWTQLPGCAVCLTRLEPSISGVVARACTHASACMCLSQDCSAGCRVCRVVGRRLSLAMATQATDASAPRPAEARPPRDEEAGPVCFMCSERQPLWICLVCGTTGCGRYASMHAHAHYVRSRHELALDLSTQRVWDYEGDRFVHRVMEMGLDGDDEDNFELELPDEALPPEAMQPRLADGASRAEAGGEHADDDGHSPAKLDRVLREYSLLLSGQLEAQRTFYEEQVAQQSEQHARELSETRAALAALIAELRPDEVQRAARAASRREGTASRRLEQLRREKLDLQELNQQLLVNTRELRAEMASAEAQAVEAERALEAAQRELEETLMQLTAQ